MFPTLVRFGGLPVVIVEANRERSILAAAVIDFDLDIETGNPIVLVVSARVDDLSMKVAHYFIQWVIFERAELQDRGIVSLDRNPGKFVEVICPIIVGSLLNMPPGR